MDEFKILHVDCKLQNICICCLKDQLNLKDISKEYNCSGQKEVYSNMIKDTFNIQILKENDKDTQYICDECILLLKKAHAFRQKILSNQHYLLQQNPSYRPDIQTDTAVREEFDEKSIFNGGGDPNDSHDDDDDDDVVLANLKGGLSKQPLSDTQHTLESAKLKKCNLKSRSGTTKLETSVNWSKVLERRGEGPLLRDNSLKLLANSTMCVFQWNKSRYRCYCCKEPFADMAHLKRHTASTHTLQDIERVIIGQQNRLVKVEVTEMECRHCEEQVASVSDLRQHLSEVHGVKFSLSEDLLVPFRIGPQLRCQLCAEQFPMFRLLNIHMNQHYRKVVCHVCGAGFSSAVFLNVHKARSHRPVDCTLCSITFPTRAHKAKHDRSCHGMKVTRKPRFPCAYCEQRYFHESARVRHMVECHGVQKPRFKCHSCPKEFVTRSLRNGHMKGVHLKVRRAQCALCLATFYTKADVARHMSSHSPQKLPCPQCRATFATKDSLRRHNKRAHAETQ